MAIAARRPLTTAREVLTWVILQDARGGAYHDPASVPEGLVGWIAATFQRRRSSTSSPCAVSARCSRLGIVVLL